MQFARACGIRGQAADIDTSEGGAGGTLKEDIIEVQGRHLDRVRETLAQIGYRVKG